MIPATAQALREAAEKAIERYNLPGSVVRSEGVDGLTALLAFEAIANPQTILQLLADLATAEQRVELRQGECDAKALIIRQLEAERDADKAEIVRLRALLRPFANIKLSSLYPEDGSENPAYRIYLAKDEGPHEFHTADVLATRAALSDSGSGGVE